MLKSKTIPPLVYSIGINKGQSIRLAAYGTILLFLAINLFSSLTGHAHGGHFNALISILVYFATLLSHEAVHGLFFGLFGGNPKYGVGLMYYFFPYAYATSPGQPYTLRQMTAIGLSPLLIICIVAVVVAIVDPSLATYASIAFVGNFSGAVGDMWLIRQILRFRGSENLLFVDEMNGIAVHAVGRKAKSVATALKAINDPVLGRSKFISRWITSAALIALTTLFIPVLLSVLNYSGHILIGPQQFSFFEYVNNKHTLSFSFNLLSSVVGGLLYSFLYLTFNRTTARKARKP